MTNHALTPRQGTRSNGERFGDLAAHPSIVPCQESAYKSIYYFAARTSGRRGEICASNSWVIQPVQ
jgi:hypothetical protein